MKKLVVFGDTLASWPKFPDTTEALAEMKNRGYKLVILSNTDENFIRQSIETIGVEFDEVITAEAVGSYKPARGHWDRMMETLGVSKDVVLHVAQSYYHDVVPATGLGFKMAWINRKGRAALGRSKARLRIPGPEKPPVHPMTGTPEAPSRPASCSTS